MKFIPILSTKHMMQKIVFSSVIFQKSTLLSLIKLKEVITENVVILNMKSMNFEVIIILYQQKDIVFLKVSISKQVYITNNNI